VEGIRAEREQPWFSEARWRQVEESAVPAVKAGLEKTSFTCPQCEAAHLYDLFVCPEGTRLLAGC